MIEAIRDAAVFLIFNLITFVLFLCRKVFLLVWRPRKYFLFSTPYPGVNRGDEALLRVSVAQMKKKIIDANDISVIETGFNGLSSFKDDLDVEVLGSYASYFVQSDKKALLKLLCKAAFAKELVFIGADLVDEGYGTSRSYAALTLLSLAGRIGIPSRLVSFSINTSPSSELKRRFKLASRECTFYPRDPLSLDRLLECNPQKVVPACDLAFLLPPKQLDNSTPVSFFLGNKDRKTIAINFIAKVIKPRHRFEMLCDELAKACRAITDEGEYQFLLFPHDSVEDLPDISFLYESFMRHGVRKDLVFLLSDVPDAGIAKAIAACCYHVFTCRLHLAIATLGVGRPVTCFPYMGKFDGQIMLFGLSQDVLIDPIDFPSDSDEIRRILMRRILQSESEVGLINSKLSAVKEGSSLNFSDLNS